MARTITFQPSPSMELFIKEQVATGDYNSQSEVIRAGLKLLKEQHSQSNIALLRQLIEEGDDSPDDDKFSFSKLKNQLDNR